MAGPTALTQGTNLSIESGNASSITIYDNELVCLTCDKHPGL